MTEKQILSLVEEYFIEEEVDDDGHRWTEYAGKPEAFLKFAERLLNEGKSLGYKEGRDDGYSAGYDAAFYEHSGY